MLEVFRAYYGITEQDDDATVREKIAGRLLLLDEGLREVLPVMFEFFGVPDPERPRAAHGSRGQPAPDLRRAARHPGARSATEPRRSRCSRTCTGSTPAARRFSSSGSTRSPGRGRLLLLNFRPEYRAAWMQKSYYRQIAAGAARPRRDPRAAR